MNDQIDWVQYERGYAKGKADENAFQGEIIKKICDNADRRVRVAFEAGIKCWIANIGLFYEIDPAWLDEVFNAFLAEQQAARQREIEENK